MTVMPHATRHGRTRRASRGWDDRVHGGDCGRPAGRAWTGPPVSGAARESGPTAVEQCRRCVVIRQFPAPGDPKTVQRPLPSPRFDSRCLIGADAEERGVEHRHHDQGQEGREAEPADDGHRQTLEERIPDERRDAQHGSQRAEVQRAHPADRGIDHRVLSRLAFNDLRIGLVDQDDHVLDQHAGLTENSEDGDEFQRGAGEDQAIDNPDQGKRRCEIHDNGLADRVEQQEHHQDHRTEGIG